MKKLDLIIIIFAISVAVVCSAFFWINNDTQNMYAEIYIDGQLDNSVKLDGTSHQVEIVTDTGFNTLQIDHDGIKIIKADCPSQTCVHTSKQSEPGGMIVCLPHRVLVILKGDEEGEVDAIIQ